MTKPVRNKQLIESPKLLTQYLEGVNEDQKFELMQLYNKQLPEVKERWEMIIAAKNLEFDLVKADLSCQFSPDSINALKPINALSALSMDAPTLATLKVYQGEITMNAVLWKLLSDLSGFFNLNGNMNDQQITITSELIYEEYPYLKISEIKFCFRKAMKGDYGELFGRLDGQIILGWLDRYRSERASVAGNLSIETARQQNEKQKGTFLSADIKKQIQELRKNLELKEQKRRAEQFSSFQYTTLEKYFESHNLDSVEEMEKLKKEWLDIYQSDVENEMIEFEVFCQVQKSRYLAEINSAKITIKKTQERIDL